MQENKINLNVNVANLDWFKCICDGTKFVKVYQLKYLSPFHTGSPTGGTYAVEIYKCMNPNCGAEFPAAKSEAEIKQIKEAVAEKLLAAAAQNPGGNGDNDGS